MHYQDPSLNALKLGQQTKYAEKYDRTLLQPVPRHLNRDALGITQIQPFSIGADIWTAYEISWLNPKGVPQVAIADVQIDFCSGNLIESKSFKLYLNSFNQTKFADLADVQHILQQDLQDCAKGEVKVRLNSLVNYTAQPIAAFHGDCIDGLDIDIEDYAFTAEWLKGCTNSDIVEETMVSPCTLYTSPSPRDRTRSRMPSSA
ncbi:7-cyano-7-deazaguanine reductase [Aggregatibacter actinomycetemcomitans serotype d str. SA3733]|nr:7-cyano-7-deazaguanine reductase [Aggregatibacter actinomycetemcomitans serotype d str. SA3733]